MLHASVTSVTCTAGVHEPTKARERALPHLTHTHTAHTTQTQHTHTFCILSYLRVVIENTRVPILRCSSFFISFYLCQILCIDFSYPLLIFSSSPSVFLILSHSRSQSLYAHSLTFSFPLTHNNKKNIPCSLYLCLRMISVCAK